MSNKSAIKNLIRWVVVAAIIVAVYFWKKQLISDAIYQMSHMNSLIIIVCLVFSVLYVILDGVATKILADIPTLSGIKSAAFCSFYKLVTLGSGSGVAEIVYLSRCGVPAENGTGIMMIQYAIHKTVVTILGIISFIILIIMKNEQAVQYIVLALVGCIASFLMVSALIIVAFSEKVANLLVKIVRNLLKKRSEKAESMCAKIISFNANGKTLVKNKKLLLKTFATDCAKLICWYAIPATVFYGNTGFSFFQSLALMAVCLMISGVLIAPAGIGTLEYVFSLFFTPIPSAITAAAAILYRFFTMIVPFVMGIPVVTFGKRDIKTKNIEAKNEKSPPPPIEDLEELTEENLHQHTSE